MRFYLVFISLWAFVSCADLPPSAEQDKPAQKIPLASKPPEKSLPEQPEKPAVKPGEITGVQIGQLFAMMQSNQVYLIDVRPPMFYRLGHIDGAVNFPLKKYDAVMPVEYPKLKAALASGKVVVLYCQDLNCPDAYTTALKLVQYGHDLSIYKGGWAEWKKSGLR